MKSIQLLKQNIKLMNILMQPGNENWTWQDLIGNDGGALRASLDVWESQLFEGVFLEDVSTQGIQTYRFIRFPRVLEASNHFQTAFVGDHHQYHHCCSHIGQM